MCLVGIPFLLNVVCWHGVGVLARCSVCPCGHVCDADPRRTRRLSVEERFCCAFLNPECVRRFTPGICFYNKYLFTFRVVSTPCLPAPPHQALPISIGLGTVFYLLTRFSLQPFVEALNETPLYL